MKQLKNGFTFKQITGFVKDLFLRYNIGVMEKALNNENYRFLTRAQIREMQNHGIRFGPHTVHHVNLAYENANDAEQEIVQSKQELERITQEECVSFCYPFGKSGYTPAMETIVRKHGFLLGFSLQAGMNDSDANPLLLNRFSIGHSSHIEQILWNIIKQ
jgi:peptidoglycan/xylan/chitin deacetylase (PgdA/CDA1 family)